MKDTPSRAARIRAGLSLAAASRKFGVRPRTLARWESTQMWSYRRALEGARHYDCSANMFKNWGEYAQAAPTKRRAAVGGRRRAA